MPPSLFERFQANHTSGPKIPTHAGEAVLLLWGHGVFDTTRALQALTVASGQPLDPDATAEAIQLRNGFAAGSSSSAVAERLERSTILRAALQALEAGLITPAEMRTALGVSHRP